MCIGTLDATKKRKRGIPVADMPERIWAAPYPGTATFDGCYWLQPYGKAVQFLRADTAISKADLRKRLEERRQLFREQLHGDVDGSSAIHTAIGLLIHELCPGESS